MFCEIKGNFTEEFTHCTIICKKSKLVKNNHLLYLNKNTELGKSSLTLTQNPDTQTRCSLYHISLLFIDKNI